MKKRLPEIKKKLSNNFGYKVVALFVTLVLWVSILGRKDDILSKDLKLEFLLAAQQKVINVNVSTIQVKVSGPRMALKKFSQHEDSITVNLKNKAQGFHEVVLTKEILNLPLGVKLISIDPKKVKATITSVEQENETPE